MIERRIHCSGCGATAIEAPSPGQPNPGFPGWGQLRGVSVNGLPDPHLCPKCLPIAASAVFGEKLDAPEPPPPKPGAKPGPKKDPAPRHTVIHHMDDGTFVDIDGELVPVELDENGKYRPVSPDRNPGESEDDSLPGSDDLDPEDDAEQ